MAPGRVAIEFNAPVGRGFWLAAFGDRRFGKTRWQGWQPLRLRFGRETDELKPENQP
jgi:hypothetical protein